jgi:hypothetical protein
MSVMSAIGSRSMTIRRRTAVLAAAILAAGLSTMPLGPAIQSVGAAAESLPARLSDQEFWRLATDFSEPNGTFRSDNLLSNELWLQYVIPDLVRTTKPGRVYMGVGPEQNFTYISAVRPRMVFIVDVRRGNRDLHLMYKALFELSADRAEFVSRLFSKPRPEGLSASSTIQQIIAGYWNVDTSETLYNDNLRAIHELLLKKHGLALTEEDVQGIDYVYKKFFWYGPSINYSSSGNGFGGRTQPSYADLMTATDGNGQTRSYLATEESFAFLKDLETKNLLVPVVGNFAGPKAIRAVGKYLKEKSATVSAFYLSNVEQYLYQDGLWRDFCRNAAALPLDDASLFIRATRGGRYGAGYAYGLSSELAEIGKEIKACAE